jgi:tRNA modification GTPase
MIDAIGGPQMRIPPSIEPLITPETFFLLNKSDLASTPIIDLPATLSGRAWPVSLSTGEGTKEFLDTFSRALQKRYVIPFA